MGKKDGEELTKEEKAAKKAICAICHCSTAWDADMLYMYAAVLLVWHTEASIEGCIDRKVYGSISVIMSDTHYHIHVHSHLWNTHS